MGYEKFRLAGLDSRPSRCSIEREHVDLEGHFIVGFRSIDIQKGLKALK